MKIINLMEDTRGSACCFYEHGFSFYVETAHHKMLIDTGTSPKTWSNAQKLGIPLTQIDTVILSHGHYDHTGGLLSLVKINPDIKIFMQKTAVYDYYNISDEQERYIGIDKAILKLPNLVLLDSDYRIDKEISVFSGVTERREWPKGNLSLKRKVNDRYLQDDFQHEQYVVIEAENKLILISGCAHNGILNILEHFKALYSKEPDIVISGFHMMQKNVYTSDDVKLIQNIANELKEYNTKFYTGHCTGLEAFCIMKGIMGTRLEYVHCCDEVSA